MEAVATASIRFSKALVLMAPLKLAHALVTKRKSGKHLFGPVVRNGREVGPL
jgi:hypothetical protein